MCFLFQKIVLHLSCNRGDKTCTGEFMQNDLDCAESTKVKKPGRAEFAWLLCVHKVRFLLEASMFQYPEARRAEPFISRLLNP